jgi:riboflavin synthase
MFTGIITEIGRAKRISRKGDFAVLEVECRKTAEGIDIGDSVAVNGVCLSVIKKSGTLSFDVVKNTFDKTNLKRLKTGDAVNLESSLKVGDDMSGHMVSGHVDCERPVRGNRKDRGGWTLDVGLLSGDERHIVPRGSVAIDGVSLTVGEISRDSLRVFLIPHTLDNTTLKLKRTGDYVNLEFDIIAKYAERGKSGSVVTEDMLREKGFM